MTVPADRFASVLGPTRGTGEDTGRPPQLDLLVVRLRADDTDKPDLAAGLERARATGDSELLDALAVGALAISNRERQWGARRHRFARHAGIATPDRTLDSNPYTVLRPRLDTALPAGVVELLAWAARAWTVVVADTLCADLDPQMPRRRRQRVRHVVAGGAVTAKRVERAIRASPWDRARR